MLTKLLCGVAISSGFMLCNCEHAKASFRFSKEAKSTQESEFYQKVCNELQLGMFDGMSQVFNEQAKQWKEFDALSKKKHASEYETTFKEKTDVCTKHAIELFAILKKEKYIEDIVLNSEKYSEKNATRKSVYAALNRLADAVSNQHKLLQNLIKKEEKNLQKSQKNATEDMDSKVNSTVAKIKASHDVAKGNEKITKHLAALCVLLKIDELRLKKSVDLQHTASDMVPPPLPPKPQHLLDADKKKLEKTDSEFSAETSAEISSSTHAVAETEPLAAATNTAETAAVEQSSSPLGAPPAPEIDPVTMAKLRQSSTLPSTKTTNPTGNNAFLDDIKKGTKLKKTEPLPGPEGPKGPEVNSYVSGYSDETMDQLRAAMDQRRADLVVEEEEEEEDWDD